MQNKGYKDLVVWKKSMDLVVMVCALTEQFPREEMYGITSQMRRCAVSLPSNIAEGSKRGTQKDFKHFLTVSFGSGAELETQIEIAKRLPFGKNLDYTDIENTLTECMKMLNVMINNTKD